ncbi:tlde1 domain-containing protein [Yersinia pseudotuberculosis]|uniref:tlde1 domain-containing protein n=1 Tax=Yersinia pseudotuberculosis TaxID=633 RepID=UPI0005DA68B1|nr:tlde1 domain-containing protein [Yersinia pseudotuberculosis]CNL05270.1 Uncharacterised protein [Yersinia pseudotuberculosis]
MAWIYKQSTGQIYHNDELVDAGYSGVLTNKNNPDRQQVRGMGPLPRGTYRITGQSTSKGPMTIILQQTAGDTFGRSLFRIHGERTQGPAGFASEGCIILGPATRRRILRSGDTTVEVVR